MSFFYRFVAAAMDLNNFDSPTPGMATPYTAFFIFSIGIFLSNFLFNTVVMKRPFVGTPVSYKEYFAGKAGTHLVGILGGMYMGIGNCIKLYRRRKSGSCHLLRSRTGSTYDCRFMGVFIWKEFTGSSKSTDRLLGFMFILFIAGLSFIVLSGGN